MTAQVTETAQLEQSLIDVAVEGWRFARLFARAVTKLDAGDAVRYQSQLRYFLKKVEENLNSNGLKLVNVSRDVGRSPFDANTPVADSSANVSNRADFNGVASDGYSRRRAKTP